MADWAALAAELDRYRRAGQTATLWWRDDDVQRPTPALNRLLRLRGDWNVPLLLAAVPDGMDDTLAPVIRGQPEVWVCQHGFAHANHAPPDRKRSELGPDRPVDRIADELASGWCRLARQFGNRLLPAMVPPWNRIGHGLIDALPELGYRGLSTFGPRDRAEPVPGLRRVNTHVDLIDWRGHRGFLGDRAVLAQLVDHLGARRRGDVDADEPTGLMTHHLVHDAPCWTFCAELFDRTRSHPAARWLTPWAAFGFGP